MKTTASPASRATSTVTIKIDPVDRERLARLAERQRRTPHYLMKEAILAYIAQEEARQNFIQAAEASYEHYRETGLHLTLDEMNAWAEAVQLDPQADLPECHG